MCDVLVVGMEAVKKHSVLNSDVHSWTTVVAVLVMQGVLGVFVVEVWRLCRGLPWSL